ncbi:MAG: hypothetical protein RR063_06665 [Anaerovoracaceae bacterium]
MLEEINLLIDGVDPSTHLKITVDTILNNEYNKRLLKEVHEIVSEYLKLCDVNHVFDKRRKLFFYISDEKKKEIPISEQAIPISTFTYTLNEFIDTDIMKKIRGSEITQWLTNKGYLEDIEHCDGKKFKILTEKASEIGMSKETKTNTYGRTYDVNLYGKQAQKFIIDHLDEISKSIEI